MVYPPSNNFPLSRKMPKFPKMANKPHCEGSEATYTNHYHCEKKTEDTKEN